MNLLGRSFLKELDFSRDEWVYLLDLAARLKDERRRGAERGRLVGKKVALLFEKTSTRTRCAFEVAMAEQGGRTTYLAPLGSQIGHKESLADTARVLGRWYDGIEFRGNAQEDLETLAENTEVPVYNGLTDSWHPTQMLADHLTMLEHSSKPAEEFSFAFLGDARNNVGNSLLISGAMLGMDVRMVAPVAHQNSTELVALANQISADTGARITITDDVAAGVAGVDFLYTDVWVSLGEAKELWASRIEALLPYQVNAKTLAATGNPETKLLHCLPAFHDLNTSVARSVHAEFGLSEMEVTHEVFESAASIVFDQAENRVHTVKAILVATLVGE